MSDLPALPRLAMLGVRYALAEGDAKHGGEATRYTGGAARHFAGARRHAARRELGEKWDSDSGARTLAHEISRLLCALEIELREEALEADLVRNGVEIGPRIQAQCDCHRPHPPAAAGMSCGACGGEIR